MSQDAGERVGRSADDLAGPSGPSGSLRGASGRLLDRFPQFDEPMLEVLGFCLDRIAEDQDRWLVPPDERWDAWSTLLALEDLHPRVRDWLSTAARPDPNLEVLRLGCLRSALTAALRLEHALRWSINCDVARHWAHHPDYRSEWDLKGDRGWRARKASLGGGD